MARFPSRENDIAVLAEALTVYERFVALRADREPLSKTRGLDFDELHHAVVEAY